MNLINILFSKKKNLLELPKEKKKKLALPIIFFDQTIPLVFVKSSFIIISVQFVRIYNVNQAWFDFQHVY